MMAIRTTLDDRLVFSNRILGAAVFNAAMQEIILSMFDTHSLVARRRGTMHTM
jgi:hypothetical protein